MDEKEFEQLAMAELDAVYRLACRLASGSQAADDFVQETYLRAFRSFATFTLAYCGIRPWLFKILHNVVFDRNASDQRQKQMVEGLHNEKLGALTSTDTGAMIEIAPRAIDWDAVDGRLKTAIDSLPAHHRVAFLLSAVEGLKYREISEVTGVPIGTVMSRLSRARQRLASQLSQFRSEFLPGGENRNTKDDKRPD